MGAARRHGVGAAYQINFAETRGAEQLFFSIQITSTKRGSVTLGSDAEQASERKRCNCNALRCGHQFVPIQREASSPVQESTTLMPTDSTESSRQCCEFYGLVWPSFVDNVLQVKHGGGRRAMKAMFKFAATGQEKCSCRGTNFEVAYIKDRTVDVVVNELLEKVGVHSHHTPLAITYVSLMLCCNARYSAILHAGSRAGGYEKI